jgi:hypothetical protein
MRILEEAFSALSACCKVGQPVVAEREGVLVLIVALLVLERLAVYLLAS